MPEKVELPNGDIVEIPDGLTQDQRNTLFQTMFNRAAGDKEGIENRKFEETPQLVGNPMAPGPSFMAEPGTIRGGIDTIMEFIGGLGGGLGAGVLSGGNPLAAMTGAGAGATGMKATGRNLQQAMGLRPQQYGGMEAAADFGINAVGEGLGLALPAAVRGVRNVFRGGADTATAQANLRLARELGITNPSLAMAVANPENSWMDLGGVKAFLDRNMFSARTMRKNAEQGMREVEEHFTRRWTIAPEGEELIPDVEWAGEMFREGYDRVVRAENTQARGLYKALFSKLPQDTPVNWTATRKFLEDRASMDEVLGSLSNDNMRKLHAALEGAYADVYRKPNVAAGVEGVPDLPEHLTMKIYKQMPIEKMKALRTEVGNLITDWSPGTSTVPRRQLKELYSALSEDLATAAEKAGALPEFEAANKFWSKTMERREKVFDKIAKRLDSDAEVGAKVQRLAKRRDSKTITAIREAFGGGSEEWHTIRNYIVNEMGTGSKGQFDLRKLAREWGGLSERTKESLLTGSRREALEKYLKGAEQFGYDLGLEEQKVLHRFGRQEMLGPTAGLFAAGGALGAGAAGEGKRGEGFGWGATIGLTLAALSPRVAAHLITEPVFVDFATKAQSLAPERVMGELGRMTSQYMTMGPEEQAAMAAFTGTFADVLGMAGNKQQRPGQMPGVISGGR